MQGLQWLMVLVGIGLLLCIAIFPFTHYAVIVDLDQPAAQDKPIGEFKGWRNSFLFIHEIDRLNNYRLTSVPKGGTSGPHPHAQPQWLVNLSLMFCVVVLSGFIVGWRPKGHPRKREALEEAITGFAGLAVAFSLGGTLVIYGFSWKSLGLAILSALGGLFFLWASDPSESRRANSKPT